MSKSDVNKIVEVKMKLCFCRTILSILVIVFAWVHVSWGQVALTVIGALLFLLSLTGACCCRSKMEAKEAPKEE
jgi:hypothetical protein